MSRVLFRRSIPAAFTLIELLVVVSIIALLISILLPSLKNARVQAQTVACAANLKSISVPMFSYQTENRGYLPRNLWSEWDWPDGEGSPKESASEKSILWKYELWFYKLFGTYIKDGRVFLCQGDPIRGQFNFEAKKGNNPRDKIPNVPSCGYGMNYAFRHWHDPQSFNMEKYPPKRVFQTLLLADVGPDATIKTAPLGYTPGKVGLPWRDGGRIVWDDGARSWFSGPTWLTARHGQGINMLALDGARHFVQTKHMLTQKIGSYYQDCRDKDCYFCRYQKLPHYSFARNDLVWWSGPYPQYGS